MYEYLVSYKTEAGEHAWGVFQIDGIAELIKSGRTPIDTYRLLPNQNPQRVLLHHERKCRYLLITDTFCVGIEGAQYTDDSTIRYEHD